MPKRLPLQHAREVFTDADTRFPVEIGDSALLDAFGHQRVAEAETLFDSSFEYDSQPLLWQTKVTGSGDASHDTDKHAVIMSVADSAGLVIRQTYAYHPYQKGKSQRILQTFVLGNAAPGIRRRVGYFDEKDGVFLEQTELGLFFVLRSSVSGSAVDARYAQLDWNNDTFDGTGHSGVILNPSHRQILDMDIGWLGVGRVRYGFNINGRTIYGHYISSANANGAPGPYMRTATLPLRYEMENLGGGDAATMIQICTSVFSEGGLDRNRGGIPFTANNNTAPIAVTARRPVLTIRPKETFNGVVNRGEIAPQDVFLHTEISPSPVLVEVVYGGLLFDGVDFSSVNDQSIVEYDVGSAIISGGYPIQSMYIKTGGVGVNTVGAEASPALARLPLTLDMDGENPFPLSIVCTALSGTANVRAALNWREFR